MSLSSTQQAPASNVLPLADIHLPQAPSWGLSLMGYGLIVCVLLLVIAIVWFIRSQRQKSVLKRIALQQLSQLTPQQTSDIARLLKQAALSHFPRERIASLHGLAWWHFVEQQLPVKKQANVHFSSRAEMLELALYGQQALSETNQQRFYDDVRYWLSHALPVKKVVVTTSTKGHQHA
ncbi:DUF4381 domain-containing protein [Aliivibrio finisterrensis]|uniref:DUF4381 domain-containing protein n=1 Tax=Aliivibrio finisterrensis TaxID=511998 RepID=A0A4Q5KR42_9GAMM|nr:MULTISPECIES: DUF4381 domain-containing protein [Aliivibrio]MDD9174034.1 DUF4381 domain-containing protein [Aliivibrio sp. S3TY1]MDD9191111.1 DUF4381 domain-containing protein [Aliivibrio sp. S2TY2]RYU48182.1 DUF4381 domain-containing protein [Aliivibrio finisterrensis]